jgi:tRNA threonylcarbamoyladenosine biosynthesis protein TsaE
MQIKYRDLADLEEISEKIITFAIGFKIWLFEGELGAGKTTLIKYLGKKLGIADTIQSPTFSLVNEYRTTRGEIIYHFDFYRIKNEVEVMDIGYEDYFYDNQYCWIEWSSKIPHLIPEKHILIHIQLEADYRVIALSKHE